MMAEASAPPEVTDFVTNALPALEQTTIADLRSPRAEQQLQRGFDNIGSYELLTADEMQAISDNGRWKGFYQQFPTAPGLVEFSRVSFNGSRTQALVHAMHLREGLWGHTKFYMLECSEDGWLVVGGVRMTEL